MTTNKSDMNETKTPKADSLNNTQEIEFQDAIALLTTEHAEVKKQFDNYQKLIKEEAESKELTQLAFQICHALSAHAQIEEELFYAAMRKAFEGTELIDEATVEHGSIKSLIEQILSSNRRDSLYDAKVKVLGEYVDHHVKEEEGEIFPKAKKLKLDLEKLGKSMMLRKSEILGGPHPGTTNTESQTNKDAKTHSNRATKPESASTNSKR